MGKFPLFDLAQNLAQCMKYHREQLPNESKVGMSLGATSGCQITEFRIVVKGREKKLKGREPFYCGRISLSHSHAL
jgi:hypothetical protein